MKPFPNPPAPPVIPDHQLIRQVGEGSYGEVWLARNIIGTYRAVKIVYRTRFTDAKPYEREFLGLKKYEPISRSHPGLVNLLQIGRDEVAGYFYYVMELADDVVGGTEFHPETYSAKTLDKESGRRERLPAQEAFQIAIHLAEALAHMHRQGLAHRDIKPSNIIFVQGRPKLADIGLVRSVLDPVSIAGTVGYIPLEGAGTAQSDIFSLGKVLYEITTGQHRDDFPALPADLATFPDRALVLEMNAIYLKACAVSLKDRYGNAEHLRADLELALAGHSVARLRFVERQLARVTRLASVAITAAVAAGIIALLVTRVRQREKGLLATSYITEGVQRLEDGNRHAALPPLAAALRLQAGDAAQSATGRQRLSSALAQAPRLLQFWTHGSAAEDVRFSPDGTRLLVAGGGLVRLTHIDSGALGWELKGSSKVQAAAFSPDGSRVAYNDGRSILVADAGTGTNLLKFELRATPKSVEFSADGTKLLLAYRHDYADILEVRTGETLQIRHGNRKEILSASFSPDGSRVVTGSEDGTAQVWETASGHKLLPVIQPSPDMETWIHDAAFSPDGRRIVTAAENFKIQVWDAASGREEPWRMEHRRPVMQARFSPDGRIIVSLGDDFMMRIWDARTGRPSGSVVNFPIMLRQMTFSPESRRVATARADGVIQIWDVMPDASVEVGPGMVSADGSRYVTCNENYFRVWNATNDQPITPALPHLETLKLLGCDAQARRIVLAGLTDDETNTLVQIYDVAAGTNCFLALPQAPAKRMWLSADAGYLITGHKKTFGVWDLQTGTPVFPARQLSNEVQSAVLSPDRRQLAVGSGAQLHLFNLASRAELIPPLEHPPHVDYIAFSPDGAVLATATKGEGKDPADAFLWNTRTGQRHGPALHHLDGLKDLRFTSDGKFLATASEDTRATLWQVATGKPLFTPIHMPWQVWSARYSPGDNWLLTTATREIRIWDALTGQPITPPLPVGDMLDEGDWFRAGGFCAGGQRVWARRGRGLSFWTLPRFDYSPDEWTVLAQHLGVTLPSTLDEPRDTFPEAKLREFCTREAARTKANLPAWHQAEARQAEHRKDWFAAQFHLACLLQQSPTEATLHARLEQAQAEVQAQDLKRTAP